MKVIQLYFLNDLVTGKYFLLFTNLPKLAFEMYMEMILRTNKASF